MLQITPISAFADNYIWACCLPDSQFGLIVDPGDASAVQRLMTWPGDRVSAATPVLFMLLRGKLYLRLQIDQTRDTATALHAMDLLRHLTEQASALPRP